MNKKLFWIVIGLLALLLVVAGVLVSDGRLRGQKSDAAVWGGFMGNLSK